MTICYYYSLQQMQWKLFLHVLKILFFFRSFVVLIRNKREEYKPKKSSKHNDDEDDYFVAKEKQRRTYNATNQLNTQRSWENGLILSLLMIIMLVI